MSIQSVRPPVRAQVDLAFVPHQAGALFALVERLFAAPRRAHTIGNTASSRGPSMFGTVVPIGLTA